MIGRQRPIALTSALLLAVTGAVTALLVDRVPLPLAVVGCCVLGGLLAALLRCRSERVRRWSLAAGATVLVLTLTELGLWWRDPRQQVPAPRYSVAYFLRDDVLGYAPPKAAVVAARREIEGRLVYDTRYTIDAAGLRVAPPGPEGTDAPCILFFGDSFTFGSGVADTQTLPYRVGVRTLGAYRIVNFAFEGYGPHQMLAALERGLVLQKARCRPRLAVYQAIASHPARAAGRAAWDRHGPRYTLTPEGVRAAGWFDAPEPPRTWQQRLSRLRDRSFLLQRLAPADELAEVPLFAGIVAAAADRLTALYPGCPFHTIAWTDNRDAGDLLHQASVAALRSSGLRVSTVSDAIPDYQRRPDAYQLDRLDRHPTPLAHDRVAAWIVDVLLAGTGGTDAKAPASGRS